MKHILIATAAIALCTSPAFAKKEKIVFVETSAVKDKPVVSLDPAKAYVLVRSDGTIPLHLMRIPSAEDQATYDRLRADSLVEAREKYAKKLAAYERDKKAYDAASKSSKPTEPQKPVEPTESNFEFTPFGVLTGVSIGPFNRFAKAEDKTSTYLQEVTPGRYRIYGLMSVMPNGGAFGSCFCMGSVGFEAKAGEITDVGKFATRELPKREGSDNARPMPLAFEFRPGDSSSIDPRLTALPAKAAVFRPVGKLPNYWGMTIDRFPEMAGVMRYDRDRIVDLTAGN